MPEATVSLLIPWLGFYAIIGSAAGALTGLMFVVIAFIASNRVQRSGGSVSAFGTPNVVHFCAALVIAAILSAPWQALWPAGIVLGLCGLGGVTYIILVILRTRHQTDYEPVMEDWLWHTILPLISYTTLVVAAILLQFHPVLALFAIGAAAVLLLFIGIHNAWDAVTYVVIVHYQPEEESQG